MAHLIVTKEALQKAYDDMLAGKGSNATAQRAALEIGLEILSEEENDIAKVTREEYLQWIPTTQKIQDSLPIK